MIDKFLLQKHLNKDDFNGMYRIYSNYSIYRENKLLLEINRFPEEHIHFNLEIRLEVIRTLTENLKNYLKTAHTLKYDYFDIDNNISDGLMKNVNELLELYDYSILDKHYYNNNYEYNNIVLI